MKAFWVQMIDLDLFFRYLKDVAMATDFVKKYQTPHFRRSGMQKRNGNGILHLNLSITRFKCYSACVLLS